MQVPKIFVRIANILGRTMLGLLLIFLLTLILVHLPPVQKQITRRLASYLSSKIEAKVEIQRITFSILGNVTLDNLSVWDPENNLIISIHKAEVASSIYNLATGDYIFDQVHLEGAACSLVQNQDGLNIQFIVDAFKSNENQSSATSAPTTLQFKNIQLQNVAFEFTSTLSGISVDVDLGEFTSQHAEFSTNPTTIKADQIIIQHTFVKTLSLQQSEVEKDSLPSTNTTLLSPDFGTDILFDIKDLVLKEDHFYFHREQVTETSKFDPAHITLKGLQVSLSNILIDKDSLGATLHTFSTQLPGFKLTDAHADIHINPNQLVLSNLELIAGINELHADITIPNNSEFAKEKTHDQIQIDARGRVDPNDFVYFFSDSLINKFHSWGPTEFATRCTYSLGKGEIKTLKVKTENSQLLAKGMVSDVFDLKTIAWKDLVVNAKVGPDFQSIVSPLLSSIHLPPDISLQLTSSGNPTNLKADGAAITTWGDAKFNGQINPQSNSSRIDLNLNGEKIDLGKWMNLSWLGPMDLTAGAKGVIGQDQQLEINGLIDNIDMLDQSIHKISFQGTTRTDNATVAISITDVNYNSEINSEILFQGPWVFTNTIQFDNFKLGRLLGTDSTLSISGDTKSKITIDPSFLEGSVAGTRIVFNKKAIEYSMDTLAFHAFLSSTKSDIDYFTDNAKANLVSNFDARELSGIFQRWSGNILSDQSQPIDSTGNRNAHINIDLENANFLKLLDIEVDEFSSLKLNGEFDEQKQTVVAQASSGEFKGYGISLDTMYTNLVIHRDSIIANLNAEQILYDSIQLGNLDLHVITYGDTATSTLLVSKDSLTLLRLQTRILRTDSGAFVYPDKLRAFNNDYLIDSKNPVHIGNNNLVFSAFQINRDALQINLDGDLNYFVVSAKNVDLTPLNLLLSPDTTLISKGRLSANISYSRNQELDLKAYLDSLILYNSSPVMIEATAVSEGNHVPFQFLLTNSTNKIDLKGHYFSDNEEVDATLLMDVTNLELFQFLVSGVIEKMNGAIQGEAAIRGPIKKPDVKGHVRFVDVGVTTTTPRLTFTLEDDRIELDNTALLFKNFTIYDTDHNPLTIDGNITSKDYQSFVYDLQINSDQYTLINNPDSISGKLRGQLVIDSNIKLKGNEKDRLIEARLKIKDATHLTFVNSSDDIELLKAEGIVDFIDPALLDSAVRESSANFYDSLISSLPDFNLNSSITLEDNAVLRVLIDEQSGDYIEASGGANVELGYDRTGNLTLTGDYTIKKGVYRLSFYDLVKKNFALVPGSSVTWSGNPKNGDLNIKAVHTVQSNSIGLIGHEIGENEKSIYKRSLNYQVGINIIGTLENPIISFSLDLPQNEKVNYPVLANKLDRLRQPEYASELNKQVFGLLVLGGFLPESSADINSNVIATTALSNSVNNLLASQLNRFASQYVKGVNIDVGIQSFSDYSAPGGKTQTAMDFRVSKSIMNDRLSFEIGGDFDINQDQSGANTGTKNYRGDIAIIYDLTGNGDKQLKLFNNETYDIIYQEIRNTGISLIFIREFDRQSKNKSQQK